MVCYQTHIFVIAIVTYECTLLLFTKIGFTGLCGIIWFLIILFESFYPFNLHWQTSMNNNTILFIIAIVTGEFTMLILNNTVFRFVLYHLVFIQLIIKFISIYPESSHRDEQQHHLTSITSYHLVTDRTPRLYQGSANHCEVDCNYIMVRLLQPSKTINYCNQSVLEILPDLNILVWSITIFDLISISALVQFFYITC